MVHVPCLSLAVVVETDTGGNARRAARLGLGSLVDMGGRARRPVHDQADRTHTPLFLSRVRYM